MAWILEVSTRERAGRNVSRVEIPLGKLTVGLNVVYPMCCVWGIGIMHTYLCNWDLKLLYTSGTVCTSEQPVITTYQRMIVITIIFYATQLPTHHHLLEFQIQRIR